MTNAYAPPIYADETVYSYVARLHLYWAETNHRSTARRWFGKSPINIDQRLPIGLEFLSKSTGNDLENLLMHHTCFPLFATFSSSPESLKHILLSNSGRSIANASNVAQAGLETLGGSWYCPICIEQDRENYGVGYWHLSHQVHGVVCCAVHSIQLRHVSQTARLFYLPPQTDTKIRVQASVQTIRFTEVILGFLRDQQFQLKEICNDYCDSPNELLRLKRQTLRRNIDMKLIMKIVRELSEHIYGSQIMTSNVVHNLLHQPRYFGHPLKFIFLSYALDQLPTAKEKVDGSSIQLAKAIERDRSRCADLLNEKKYSLREIARRINRSIHFVKALSCQMGIRFQKRTQFVTPDVEARIIVSAKAGKHRKAIAQDEGVSVGTVEQLIQSSPGLSKARRQLKKEERRKLARNAIRAVLQSQPSITRKELKSLRYSDYTWLYRHDKTWLYDTLPPANNQTKL